MTQGRGRGLIVYSLTECMSKFLALGFSLPPVVRMTTANSARAALGMSAALGSLAVGQARPILSILRLVPEGQWQFLDSLGETLPPATQALVPVATIGRAGRPHHARLGAAPLGLACRRPAPVERSTT